MKAELNLNQELEELKQRLEFERQARIEAEAIVQRVTRDAQEEQRRLELLQMVTVAANQATSVKEALQISVDQICARMNWALGHAYLLEGNGSMELVEQGIWNSGHATPYTEFIKLLSNAKVAPGCDLPGAVWRSGKPAWRQDIRKDPSHPRAMAMQAAGLLGAFNFPLLVGPGVVGVLELFSEKAFEPDSKWLQLTMNLGALLGRVVEREQAQIELRRSETYFRKLTENALDLITILNADGTIRYESRSIQQVLGFSPEEYNGQNAFSFVHPDDIPLVASEFQDALKRQGNTKVLNFRFRHKDGTYRTLEGIGLNLLNDPDVAGIVFNSRDVTERKRLEGQFLQAQKVQAIGQLAAGVAHDFNNILTAILGYSDMTLMRMEANHPLHSNVAGIKQAAFRAAALTGQLLAFGRKQMLEPSVMNLNHSIIEIEKMLRRLLGADIALVTVPQADLGNVKADPSQIEQVILNLAVNARDAMPKGGRLTLETANVFLDEEYARRNAEVTAGPYVMLAVTDNGTGIPPEVRARLFEPFFTTKEIGKGTGLGLATCHGVVKQSGGHIAVYSELGQGTTFKVYLPRVDAVPVPKAATEGNRLLPRGTETVLLAEDEPMLRDLAAKYLAELGYDVLSAANGRQALNLVHASRNKQISILISDVVMPEMGGKDLASFLHNVSPNTKVVFCSGYTEDAVNLRGTIGTGAAFIPKPFSMETLAIKVREMLDK